MRALESWLNGIWYGSKKPPFSLRVLSAIYEMALRWRHPVRTEMLRVPVVVVGNFTAGGTGKTPLIITMVKRLKALGFNPGVVSRGYGRNGNRPVTVHAGCDVASCGDEPFLIALRTEAPVRVDVHRRNAALHLVEQGCDVIISDDGMQHRALPRNLEIEVFDAVRGYGNGRLLPAGPLRETVRPVDLRVGNGLTEDAEDAYAMRLVIGSCYGLNTGEQRLLVAFRGRVVHALAGIGNPQRFFNALASYGLDIIPHPFPDHHRFSPADLPELGPVMMTEKDAVKCQGMDREDVWVVPVEAQLSDAFMDVLVQRIRNARRAE